MENTRKQIIIKAAELFHKNGFNATGVNKIVKELNLTKGAFFHYFPTKKDLCLAVINEYISGFVNEKQINAIDKIRNINPLPEIFNHLKSRLLSYTSSDISFGCPVQNMMIELSSVDEEFRSALATVMHEWEQAFAETIDNGKKNGFINKQVNSRIVASFLVMSFLGARNLGKIVGIDAYNNYLHQIEIYLSTLD